MPNAFFPSFFSYTLYIHATSPFVHHLYPPSATSSHTSIPFIFFSRQNPASSKPLHPETYHIFHTHKPQSFSYSLSSTPAQNTTPLLDTVSFTHTNHAVLQLGIVNTKPRMTCVSETGCDKQREKMFLMHYWEIALAALSVYVGLDI